MASSLLIVDSDVLVRAALRKLVEAQGVLVVGESDNGDDAVRFVRKNKPDLVILDVNLPDAGGCRTIESIIRVSTNTRVIVFTANSRKNTISRAVKCGASAIILKSEKVGDISAMIESVISGHKVFPSIDIAYDKASAIPEREIDVALNSKELSIFRCLAEGMKMVKVASDLNISISGAYYHRNNLMRKLSPEAKSLLKKAGG